MGVGSVEGGKGGWGEENPKGQETANSGKNKAVLCAKTRSPSKAREKVETAAWQVRAPEL